MPYGTGYRWRVGGEERVVYNDFSGGDYGEIGGAKAPANSFSALNMLVTADGYLCPRPGWADRSPTNMPVGKVLAMTPTSQPTRDMMFIVGNTVYTYDLANAPTPGATAASMTGTLATTPTLGLYPKLGTTEFYITVPGAGGKCYKLNPVANTVTALTSSPAGSELEVYGTRLVVATTGNRIKFSEAADFNTWPSANFIDIGDLWAITGLRDQNNHLSIFKSRGKYALTGVPGVNPTVRKTERALGVLHPGQLDADEDDRLWFIPAFHQNPASYDGVATKQVDYLKSLTAGVRDADTPVLPLVLGVAESIGDRSPSTVVVAQGGGSNIMLINHNGVWTRHTTSVTISGMVRGGYTGDFYVTDGGSASTAGKIYSNVFNLNRPGLSTDTLTRPGDNSNTPVSASVTFPQFWAPERTEVRVGQVIVDFEKYKTGVSATNHFDIEIDMIGRIPAGKGDAGAVTYSWDEANSAAGASVGDHKRDRKVQGAKTAFAAGYELSLKNVRGVKIKSVTVVLELAQNRPETH